MADGLETALIALVAGTLSVLLAVGVLRIWDARRAGRGRRAVGSLSQQRMQPMVFLFRDRRLVDATAPARHLLDRIGAPEDDWLRLQTWLGARLPDAPAALAELDRTGRVEVSGTEGLGTARLTLLAEDLGAGLVRLRLTDPTADHAGIVVDSLSQQAMEEELDLLRRAMDQTPMLVWRQDGADRITWANAAYLRRAEEQSGGTLGWPLPRLLEAPKPVPGAGTATRRAPLDRNGVVSWYDCHSHRAGDQTMMFALPADAAVRAERSLREFVQTLTKTFADLPIGLAIFDRQRNLQLFNPALIDLLNLPTGFLTARPSLFDFLDKLRELRMAPEPRDYRSWRQQIANLETAAATGHHAETWSLPGGQTYRVTGRPHPDGAVAFLFDDITSEMTLTRKFRSELSLGAQVLDGVEDALAVFGVSGQLQMSNAAYRRLWGEGGAALADHLEMWRKAAGTLPGAGAVALCARMTTQGPDAREQGAMAGPAGQLIAWQVTRLPGARQLVRFRLPDMGEVAAPISLPVAEGDGPSPRLAGPVMPEMTDVPPDAPRRNAVGAD